MRENDQARRSPFKCTPECEVMEEGEREREARGKKVGGGAGESSRKTVSITRQ